VITVADTTDGTALVWQPLSRHPLQWMVAGFGAIGVVMMLFFMVMIYSGEMTKQTEWSQNVDPMIEFSPLFVLPHLLIASFMIWVGLKKGHPQEISLGQATFNYDTGSPALPIPFGWFFWPMFMHGSSWFGGAGSEKSLFLSRKQYEIPTDQLAEFKLERVGERQRLTVDHGADRIEIGAELREPEREWLAELLQAWRQTVRSS
jgi:hypothetical protein